MASLFSRLIRHLDRSPRAFRVGLALVAVVFLTTVASRTSLASFGFYHDDALYFASAQALAAGDGYRAPSLPGAPPQTKYPILYPLTLSLVWLVEPEYPQNLAWAYGLNALFGLALVLVAAALLRQWGLGRAAALALTAAFALHPHTVYWTGALLSEALFGALALGALAAGARALDESRFEAGRWALAITLAAAATLTRSIGVAFVAGLVAWALWKRRRFAALAAVTAALPLVWGLVRTLEAAPVTSAAAPPALVRTFAYYSSYAAFWRLSTPDLGTFAAQTAHLLVATLQHPGTAVFGLPAGAFAHSLLQMAAVALTAGVVHGAVVRARRNGLHPVHFAVAFYLPITLVWNYPLLTRFWLPFLPLLLAGAATELGDLARAVRRAWSRPPAANRGVAGGFAVALAGLLGFAAYRHLVALPRALDERAAARARLQPEKREAYDWLRPRSKAVDPPLVISYEDAATYLATGLQCVRPTVFTTGWVFRSDEVAFERELEGLGVVARALGARYWLVAEDDFGLETAPARARSATTEFLAGRERVFTSSSGSVRIYRLPEEDPMKVSQDKPMY